MGTEQEVELQKHLERRLASLLEEFEHWYGRPVTMATLCTVAASAVAVEQQRGPTPWRRGTARSRWSMTAWPRRRGSSGRQSRRQPATNSCEESKAFGLSRFGAASHLTPSNEILTEKRKPWAGVAD